MEEIKGVKNRGIINEFSDGNSVETVEGVESVGGFRPTPFSHFPIFPVRSPSLSPFSILPFLEMQWVSAEREGKPFELNPRQLR